MLALLRRLRIARLLALLAVLVTAGIGPHLHGASVTERPGTMVLLSAAVDHEDGNTETGAASVHCGVCHVARGVVPATGGVSPPAVLALRLPVRPGSTGTDRLAPDVPSPPPRVTSAA